MGLRIFSNLHYIVFGSVPILDMAYVTKFTALRLRLSDHRRLVTAIPPHHAFDYDTNCHHVLHNLYLRFSGKRRQSSNAEWATKSEFAGRDAYDILGVSQTSSFSHIKACFRKLAKETHPDLARAQSHDSSASEKFIQILAAYEILSDPDKRANYDRHLLSQRNFIERNSKRDPIVYSYDSYGSSGKKMEVVEWLKWYRNTVNDILGERRAVAGSGYFEILERDFYSALHLAYYGPGIESLDLLPNCFEAEERSMHATSEVLHLVSGRDLFGMVCLANKYPELPHAYKVKLKPHDSSLVQFADNVGQQLQSDDDGHKDLQKSIDYRSSDSDAYRDLELHISGRVVAMATRFPPKNYKGLKDEDSEDQIHVNLILNEELLHGCQVFPGDKHADPVGSGIPLGIIKGLGTSTEEGTCSAYNSTGIKTHMIVKHRTLMVKHLHWYRIGEEFSICECRCSRARLPPSKFWLFEPRSAMHDVGGWYVETFGRDKKGKTVPEQRCWDGIETTEQFEERLHPAMYLLALAYRTLDIENARRRKQTIKDKVEKKMSKLFSWCKKLA